MTWALRPPPQVPARILDRSNTQGEAIWIVKQFLSVRFNLVIKDLSDSANGRRIA